MQTSHAIFYIICYAIVFVLSWVSKTNKNQLLFNAEGEITLKPGNLLGIHLIGILWLGLIPITQLDLSITAVLLGDKDPEILNLLTIGLLLPLTAAAALKLTNNISPRTDAAARFMHFSKILFMRYFIIRAVYISVYELWFRGFLLFETINWLGAPVAVLLNVMLYAALHIYKSKKEILACIPFGLLLCVLSTSCNAAWPAVILHVVFAIAYELNIYKSFYLNIKATES